MWRRQLLANLGATAAAAAGSSLLGTGAAQQGDAALGDLLADRLRDAMLSLDTAPAPLSADRLHAELAGVLTDFHACRYGRLTTRLPRPITAGHTLTRMFIKLDDQQLGWMAADRARAPAPHLRGERGRRTGRTAERHAPEETHARPAIRAMVSGLLVTGRTTPKLRGFAARCRIR